MKIYIHYEGAPEHTLVVNIPDGEPKSVKAVKEQFIGVYNKKHGASKTFRAHSVYLKNIRGKRLEDSDDLKRHAKDRDDFFVVEDESLIVGEPNSAPETLPAKLKQPPQSVSSKQTQGEGSSIDELIRAEKFEHAIRACNIKIKADPFVADAYSQRSAAQLGLKNYTDAVTDANRALAIDITQYKAFQIKGEALTALGDPRGAILCFQCAASTATTPAEKELCVTWLHTLESAVLKRFQEKDKSIKEIPTSIHAPALTKLHSTAADLVKKGRYDLAHTIYVDILESAPDDETSLGQLIAVWNAAGNVPRAIEYLIRVIIFNQKHFNYRAELGKAFQKNGDYPVAVRCFLAGVQLASESSLAGPAKTAAIYEIQALLGQAMFQMGEPDAGLNFVVKILQQDEDHFGALYSYALIMLGTKQYDEASKVFLRLLIRDPENALLREKLTESIRHPEGFNFVKEQLITIPNPASAMAFIATVVKDWGGIHESVVLYEASIKAAPAAPSYWLNLIHSLEALNEYTKAFAMIKAFCLKNPSLHVGSLTCADIYNEICHIDDVYEYQSWKGSSPKTASSSKKLEVSKRPPSIPLADMYTVDQLDTLAIFCTAVKIVYVVGALELIKPLSALIDPVREGRPMHTTTIRNEHAYFCCINQLMTYHSLPLDSLQTIYVAGDSHSMPPAWHTATVSGQKVRLSPLLVTGMKAWHLRPDGKFYPKDNFYSVVPTAPPGSSVIMLFGEIDCREGFIISVQKMRYKDIDEAALVTIDIYIKALLDLQQKYNYKLYIHPVVPVLNVTRLTIEPCRSIVVAFNKLLKLRVLATPSLIWLDFFDDLLTPEGTLVRDFELDGTHLSPKYLPLLERALNAAQN